MIGFFKKLPLTRVYKGFQHILEERGGKKEHLVLRYVWNPKFSVRNDFRSN